MHYENGAGVPRHLKIKTIALLWVGLIVSAVLVDILWVRASLLVVGIGVTAHVVMIKKKHNECTEISCNEIQIISSN